MTECPHFCECDDCLNRGNGVRLDQLKPRPKTSLELERERGKKRREASR